MARNPALLLLHCLLGAAAGLMCGGIFYGMQLDLAGAQGRLGAIFFALTLTALTSLTTIDLLIAERGLVVREVAGGYYRPSAYYLSKAALDGLLLRVAPALLFAAAFYPLSGFRRHAAHAAVFAGVLSAFAATVGALSLACAAGAGSAGRAALAMNLVLLFSLLVAGFLVNNESIPVALRCGRKGAGRGRCRGKKKKKESEQSVHYEALARYASLHLALTARHPPTQPNQMAARPVDVPVRVRRPGHQ
jgi:hypothetical protein